MTQLGKYDILEELGRGGFGVVYHAMDTGLQVERALKVLHPALIVDPEMAARFKREAQIAARMEHPNIVPVYDIGEAEGRIYLAMKYMAGGSLKERLGDKGALDFDKALVILQQVASGLDHAHQQEIIHRDLKPGNILFDEQGKIRISDFGFAKVLIATGSSTTLTMSGGILGTPAYMAPELWNGTPPPSPATDVYALACVFYEMITGKVLFDGETPMAVMRKHADGPDFSLTTTLSRDTILVLKKAFFKNPQARFKKMRVFVEALSQSCESQTADLKRAPLKDPRGVVQQIAAEVKPTRRQEPLSQRDDEASLKEPITKSNRVDMEYSKPSTFNKVKINTKLMLCGGLGLVGVVCVIVVIVLIGIGVVNLGGRTQPVDEEPVAINDEPREEYQEEITEEPEEEETEPVELNKFEIDQEEAFQNLVKMKGVEPAQFSIYTDDDHSQPGMMVFEQERVIIKNLVTGEIEIISDIGYRRNPVFSPDGKQAAYTYWDDTDNSNWRGKILITDLSSMKTKEVFDEGDDSYILGDELSWSLDGKWVASCGVRNILILHVDTGDYKIFNNDYQCEYISWSPKGDKIVFMTRIGEEVNDADSWVPVLFDLSHEDFRLLEEGNDNYGQYGPYLWSSTGESFVYQRFSVDDNGNRRNHEYWILSTDGKIWERLSGNIEVLDQTYFPWILNINENSFNW